jgi:hypothetical protein
MNRRTVILTLAVFTLVLGAIGAYASWPRHADLRGFEPAEIARLETAMWRDYYENRYVALFGRLYELCFPRQLPWAGDDGSGLVGDRVPVATRIRVAEGGGLRRAGSDSYSSNKKAPDDAGAFRLLI